MMEPSKKRPRKSKLELRKCLDLEDYTDVYTQMQETPEGSLTLLSKLKCDTQLDDTNVETPPSPVQFSVQLEVESCLDDGADHNNDPEQFDSCPSALEPEPVPLREVIVSNDTIRKEVQKLSSSGSYCDRQIEIEIFNYWGHQQTPHVPDELEEKVQKVLAEWRVWFSQSKIRTLIHAYKCNICSIGWWHLDPFRDHIRIHAGVELKLEPMHHECCIATTQGQWFESICLCKIEGNCPRCLKSYEQHDKQKRGTLSYYCDGCHYRFPTCSALFAHEGGCARYAKIIFQNVIPTESMWKCSVCNVVCLTQARHEEHMSIGHTVRSDALTTVTKMRTCAFCNQKYHLHTFHCCPKRMANYRCKYCYRKFQNKIVGKMHELATKNDYYCRICYRYFNKHCMAPEHLVKHSRNYVMVQKCLDCLDNVLLSDEREMIRHINRWHPKGTDRRGPECIFVPKVCMTSKCAEDKSIADMVDSEKLDQKKQVPLNEPLVIAVKMDEPGLNEVKNKKEIEVTIDKEMMDKMCTELRDKMLKRASTTSQDTASPTSTNLDYEQVDKINIKVQIETASETIKTEENSLDGVIKQEINNEDIEDTDADINETENSVNALLSAVNVKDEIEIVEHDLGDIVDVEDSQDCFPLEEEPQEIITVDDSDDSNSDEESSQNSLKIIEGMEELVNLAILKKETGTEHDDENKEQNANETKIDYVEINTEVVIKQENEDVKYEDIHEDEIKKEHEACLEEFSKVFKASKTSGTFELSGISLGEELKIKEEAVDHDNYEDDIIMLNLNKTTDFDVTVTAENVKTEDSEETSSESSEDLSSDIEPLASKAKIKRPFKKIITADMKEIVSRGKKLYHCNKCNFNGGFKEYREHRQKEYCKSNRKAYKCRKCSFIGGHKDYMEHMRNTCQPGKYGKPVKFPNHWADLRCTKCNSNFASMKEYCAHFTKHKMKLYQCPKCKKDIKYAVNATHHVTSHVKYSFMKIQMLNKSSCVSSKMNGVFQCKVCDERVQSEEFFKHWEQHLDLDEPVAYETLKIDDELSPGQSNSCQLTLEQIKLLLDQLTPGASARGGQKRCRLCARGFHRVNDVKRHVIEHLLRDSLARQPSLVCQMCQLHTKKTSAYKAHMRVHASMPLFGCEMCDKFFSDSSNFAKHKKVHNIKVFSECDLCKKKFHSKYGLEKHLEMHQTTEPIKCECCSRVFYNVSAYKKHRRTMRPTTNRCRVCSQRFPRMQELWSHLWDEHKIRHTEADCPICHQKFRKFQEVRAHLRTVHKAKPTGFQLGGKRAHGVGEEGMKRVQAFCQRTSEVTLGAEETLVVYDV